MELISLEKSKRKGKRFVITFNNPRKTIHFGSDVGQTYIDHHDKVKRTNYLARHIVNEDWSSVNAGSLSRFLLWGSSRDIDKNLEKYLDRFNISRPY
mgnify:CR=1 FL=1|tara:strand:+ start:48 stop:338 length:291 start_codon:yes stop_codon:yes gene_type:complete